MSAEDSGAKRGRPRKSAEERSKRIHIYYRDSDELLAKIAVIMDTRGDHSMSSLFERLIREEYMRTIEWKAKEAEISKQLSQAYSQGGTQVG